MQRQVSPDCRCFLSNGGKVIYFNFDAHLGKFLCASLFLYPLMSLFGPLIRDICHAEKANAVALSFFVPSLTCKNIFATIIFKDG